MKKRLLIIGGYGSGEVAMAAFQDYNRIHGEWFIEGYLSDVKPPGEFLGQHKVIGTTEEVSDYVDKGYYIHYALHFNAKKKYARVAKFKALNLPLEANASVIHPRAYVNPEAKIGYGVLISPFAYASLGTQVGNCVHIYPHAVLTHGSIIEDYCTVAVHSVVGGRVILEEGVHAGINASIREDLRIGRYAVIGMGAVVVNNVAEFSIVAGNPARKIGGVDN